MDTKGKRKGQDELGDWDCHIYPIDTKYKTDDSRTACRGRLCSTLCGDLNGKEIQKRGDAWIHTAGSVCCTAETDTTL